MLYQLSYARKFQFQEPLPTPEPLPAAAEVSSREAWRELSYARTFQFQELFPTPEPLPTCAAEREGFEPSRAFRPKRLSRAPP
jgi:hypothetical protein